VEGGGGMREEEEDESSNSRFELPIRRPLRRSDFSSSSPSPNRELGHYHIITALGTNVW
jgi:hypothetical protein